jgi:hypothetical protein
MKNPVLTVARPRELLPRPRSYEIRATEAFLALKGQALTLIREEAIKATNIGA